MAATLIGEIWAGRRTKKLADGTREHTRVFRVDTSVGTDGGMTVAAAAGLPVQGDAHPDDAAAHCLTVDPQAMSEDRTAWLVMCEYSTVLTYQVDPTTRPTQYSWSTEYVQVAAVTDLDGLIIQNSAHEALDPPASEEVPVDVIKATCIRAAFIRSQDKDPYLRKVNSTPLTIDGAVYAPGQAILWDLDVDMIDEGGTFYRKYAYTFKARRDMYTTSTATFTAPVTAGSNVVVPVSSLTGIVVGTEIVVDEGIDQETIIVEAVDLGSSTITADFVNNHADDVGIVIRSYNPWQYRPLDQGFNEWDSDLNRNREIFTVQGQPIANPVLLDGSGLRLATWTEPPQEPVRLLFRLVDSADLSAITFP